MSNKGIFFDGVELSDADERAYQRESLIYNVAEDLLLLLEDNNLSKNDLARRLNKSRSYVTQALSGARNLTLGSLSDICFALNASVKITMHSNESTDVSREQSVSYERVEDVYYSSVEEQHFISITNVIDKRDRRLWSREAA